MSRWFKLAGLGALLMVGLMLFGPRFAWMSTAQPLDPTLVAVENDNLKQIDYRLGERTFRLEVALTQDQLYRGLMYRTHLPEGQGMLFPFAPPRTVSFWMKNTLIPLDMIFIRRGKVVHIVHNVPPCKSDPCPGYSSVVPVDQVVELPAGTARGCGIDVGASAQALETKAENAAETAPLENASKKEL